MSLKNTLYDQDFYAWANTQAELLRAGKLAEADIENIAEEIESMGKTEKRELVSRLEVLLVHLLKWHHQQSFQCRSWELTIKEQRAKLRNHLHDNPSLRPKIPECFEEAYGNALYEAERQTGLARKTFPHHCGWMIDDVLAQEWLPLN